MTTIVYRDGVMAAEGRSTLDDTIITDCALKITRLSDGALIAIAGEDSYEAPLIRYLEDEQEELPQATPNAFAALLVEVDGTTKLYSGVGDFTVVDAPFIAIGSGAPYAYGALEMGASARDAVGIAISRDPNSGGAIQVERLGHQED